MAKHKQTRKIAFEEVVERGCGFDVHKKEIVATVSGTGIESETRTFQSTTRSLTELKEWLLALGVTITAKTKCTFSENEMYIFNSFFAS